MYETVMRSRNLFALSIGLAGVGWLISFLRYEWFLLSLFLFALSGLAAVLGLLASQHKLFAVLINLAITAGLLIAIFYVARDADFRASMAKYGHCFKEFDDKANREGLAEMYGSRKISKTIPPENFVIENLHVNKPEPQREWSFTYKTIDGKYAGLARGDGCGLMEAWPDGL